MDPNAKPASPDPTSPPVPTPVSSDLAAEVIAKTARLKPRNFLVWAITGAVGLLFAVVLALIIIGVNMIISSSKNVNLNQPQPPPETAQPAAVPPKISKFATDSAVLGLRDGLAKLRSDIDSNDPFEPQLAPPSLDLGISIPVAP